MAKTFDQIADEQGWNDHSISEIELGYATSAFLQGMTLAQYAQEIADEENGGSEENWDRADEIVSELQDEDFYNFTAEEDPSGEYQNDARDRVRDGILFALDNGWTPEVS